jgi:branched-chain amino acid transport system ATP-binding protein
VACENPEPRDDRSRGTALLARAIGAADVAAPARSRYLHSPEDEEPGMAGGYIIETRDLSKEFRGFRAVSDVNLRVRHGSIHALIGPNGAGKTTVFNLLTKFLEPSRGQILYDGRDITRAKPADLAREGMVRSFQISATFPHLTVLENVRIALQRRLGTSFHFWRSEASLDVLNERAQELIEAVGLAGFADSAAAELPYGRKRALEIATTLALEPKLMLLDEPTAGMGHEDVGRVAALIKKVAQDRTVLMVEHNLSVVADLSDVITVLQRGRILAEGSYDEVSNNPEVREAYMGTGHA